MDQNRRNIAVGATVLAALAMLGGMIILFTGLPEAFQGGYELYLQLPATGNALPGDLVHLSGIRVGRVTDIGFTDPDNPGKGVTIRAMIDGDVRIPGNAVAHITKSMMGPSYVELRPDGPPRYDPETGRLWRFLPTDRKLIIEGEVRGGDAMEQLRPALDSLAALGKSIGSLIRPADEAETPAATEPSTQGGLSGTVARLNRTLDALEALLGDTKMRTDIKTSVANLAEATDKAKDAMDALKNFAAEASKTAVDANAKLDDLSHKLMESAEEISKLMRTINQIAMKAESGEGTAGKILNDPTLYHNLEEASSELKNLIRDFDSLVNEWRQKGFKLR